MLLLVNLLFLYLYFIIELYDFSVALYGSGTAVSQTQGSVARERELEASSLGRRAFVTLFLTPNLFVSTTVHYALYLKKGAIEEPSYIL
jgi:hypothetical protein